MGRDEIEERLSRLDSQTNLSTQLRFALDYISSDPHSSLTKSRVVLEKIVHDLFLSEMGSEPRKPILGDMLANKQFARMIDRRILSRMHSIRDMANLGPHGEFVTEKDAIRVLDDLSEVLDWYVGHCQEGRDSGSDQALVRKSAPELITKEITGITRRPEPKKRSPRKPGLWLVLAPVLLVGVAAALYFLLFSGGEERQPGATGAEIAAPSPGSPDEAEHFSSAPVALRWEGPAGHEQGTFEVEVVRLKGTESGTTSRASVPLDYVLWPWESGDPAPGTYSWRVRVGGSEKASWSEPRTFAYYRSALDRVLGEKQLRVGAETTYHPPFVQYDVESKAVAGFDVELAREIAKQLDVEHEHVAVPWDELFESVDQGNVDLVISAVTISAERSERFAFSRPYFTTWQRMTVRADTTRTAFPGPDSAPFIVGTQKGTTAAVTAAEVAGATVKLYDTLDLAIVALSTKEIDVLISDEVFSPARHDRNFKLIGERLTREDYGVMLPRGEDELLGRVNAVIEELAADGWLDAARARHDLSETATSTPDAGAEPLENQ